MKLFEYKLELKGEKYKYYSPCPYEEPDLEPAKCDADIYVVAETESDAKSLIARCEFDEAPIFFDGIISISLTSITEDYSDEGEAYIEDVYYGDAEYDGPDRGTL